MCWCSAISPTNYQYVYIWKSKYRKWSWIKVCTSIKIISMQTTRKDLCWNNDAINDTMWDHTLQCSRSREILIMHDTCLTNRFSEAKWKAVRMAGNQNLNYWAMELSLKMSSLESIFPKEISQNILVPLCDFFLFFLFFLNISETVWSNIISTLLLKLYGLHFYMILLFLFTQGSEPILL